MNKDIYLNNNYIATFESKDVSTIPIIINISNLNLDKKSSNNYFIKKEILSGYINKKELTVKFIIENKEYDNTDTVVVKSYSLVGIIENDIVNLNTTLFKL